jgi:tellurite resistance protein TehA-like permease
MNFRDTIKNLSPAYFALVMATGILSVACHLLKYQTAGVFLFWLNNVQFAVLSGLFLYRAVFFFSIVKDDFKSNEVGAGFLTIVAGTAVLGVQHQLIMDWKTSATFLWLLAITFWIFILYAFFGFMITKAEKPPVHNVVNGSWLLITVSTQSLAVLGTSLIPSSYLRPEIVLFITLSFFLLAVLFFVVFFTLVMLRFLLASLPPKEFTPPYWVLMGSAAITALAGAVLTEKLNITGLYPEFGPIVAGISVAAWAVASWLIPLLVLLECWRHIYKKVPGKYTPAYWDTVFTLGMYTSATFRLSKVLKLEFLSQLPRLFIFLAAAAWLITFAGMIVAPNKND